MNDHGKKWNKNKAVDNEKYISGPNAARVD